MNICLLFFSCFILNFVLNASMVVVAVNVSTVNCRATRQRDEVARQFPVGRTPPVSFDFLGSQDDCKNNPGSLGENVLLKTSKIGIVVG